MDLDVIESRFCEFLSNAWKEDEVAPFLRSYVRLLLAFRSELSRIEVHALLERQRQLAENGEAAESFRELRIALRERINRQLGNEGGTREEAITRLLFCAFIDSPESDFFYLAEPMFEFARKMEVDPDLLNEILKSEFPRFDA